MHTCFRPHFRYFGNFLDSVVALIEGQFACCSLDIHGSRPILAVEIRKTEEWTCQVQRSRICGATRTPPKAFGLVFRCTVIPTNRARPWISWPTSAISFR